MKHAVTVPDTRPSLILRVRNPHDGDAWLEFSSIYRPVIVRLACRKGLQTADAEDLAQLVLLAVSRAIVKWQPDADQARFRTWLNRIVRNAALNALTRRLPDRAAGTAEVDSLLNELPGDSAGDSELLRMEFRREMFLRAAAELRDEFSEDTWSAFWLTTVEGLDIDLVADRLGKHRGSIYAARSRVMRRLRDRIERLDWPESGEG